MPIRLRHISLYCYHLYMLSNSYVQTQNVNRSQVSSLWYATAEHTTVKETLSQKTHET